ncbi:MAG: HDIG domain-containing metalloprotein [Trueperaceae bacterium]
MSRRRSRRRERRPPGRVRPFLLSMIAISALLYSVYGQRQSIPLEVGSPSPERFVAPTDLRVPDPLLTERRRQAAQAQVPDIRSVDPVAEQVVLSALAVSDLPEPVLSYLLDRYQDPAGVTAEQLPEVTDAAVAQVLPGMKRDVRLVLRQRLLPTSHPDPDLTAAARAAAAAAVPAALRQLDAGEVIVDEGSEIRPEHLRALEAVGLYDPATRQLRQAAVVIIGCLLVGTLLALPVLYAARTLRHRIGRRQFRFLVGLSLVTLALQRATIDVSHEFVFVLWVPILVSILLGRASALLWATWFALAVGLLVPGAPLSSAAAVLIGSVAAIMAADAVPNRMGLLAAGPIGGLVSGFVIVALQMMHGGVAPVPAATEMGAYLAGGALAGVVALGLLPLAEGPVEFLTEFRLTELSSPQSPLLQKLVLEAPGSYQHTQLIANLVEQAVQRIGGDALLARVGALYHDVGKIRRPQFFVENQSDGRNPHDRLSPHLSYLIITSHVRDGIQMLRDHALPSALEPFVAEHHGTTVLAYFYKRALEDSDRLDELNFRYPGPKPQSRESAVLMLADTVEAASRTLPDPTQGSIRAMIDRLFEQRLQDDQLSESPLTFRDLETIASVFERVMTASLHRRVKYPSADEIQGLKRDRDVRRDGSRPAS